MFQIFYFLKDYSWFPYHHWEISTVRVKGQAGVLWTNPPLTRPSANSADKWWDYRKGGVDKIPVAKYGLALLIFKCMFCLCEVVSQWVIVLPFGCTTKGLQVVFATTVPWILCTCTTCVSSWIIPSKINLNLKIYFLKMLINLM